MMRQPLLKPRKRRVNLEARFQKAVVQVLTVSNGRADRQHVLWFSIPNEGNRGARYMQHLKEMGLRPGAADLCIVVQGKAHFLELKTPTGRMQDTQWAFRQAALAADASYATVTNMDEALAVLREWEALPMRGDRNSAVRAAA